MPSGRRPGPLATLLGVLIGIALLVVLLVFVLPLALILLAVLILVGLGVRAKMALDNLGRRRNNSEGRKNVRIINR